MYYNTTNEKQPQLQKEWENAENQQQAVLMIFNQFNRLTASECWKKYEQPSVPLTSIRRAITDLTYEGKLIKTSEKKKGIYGKPEYVYALKFSEKLF